MVLKSRLGLVVAADAFIYSSLFTIKVEKKHDDLFVNLRV